MAAIYLSKNGQTFGPFDRQQIDRMRVSGELSQYQWLFEDPAKGWQPVVPPPAPPPATHRQTSEVAESLQYEPEPKVAQAAPQQAEDRLGPSSRGSGWAAILHDGRRNVVSGVVSQIGEGSCLVGATLPRTTLPIFRPGAVLTLNLLDPETNRAENVSVRVEAVTQRARAWEYRVGWKSVPKLLSSDQLLSAERP